MTDDTKLPERDVWQSDGHLSDVAITALADGEDSLLPEPAVLHAEGCDSCSSRLADQAVLAVSLSEALAVRAPEAVPVAQPVPVFALLAALVLALLGALPTLLAAPPWLVSLPATLMRTAPIALRLAGSVVKVASSGGTSVIVVWASASLVLAALGLFVARLAPREVAWKGAEK